MTCMAWRGRAEALDTRARSKTALAALASFLAASALILQFALLVERFAAQGEGPLAAAWRFVGFFTILSNFAVAIVGAAMALAPQTSLARPRARLAAATSITLVGLVYSLALRDLWSPEGWQAVADHAMHDATPVLFVLAWALDDHGALRWRDVGAALAPALIYCVYSLTRGFFDGWYPYWFLDPTRLSWPAIGMSVGALSVAFTIVALGFVAVDRWLGRRNPPE